MDIAGTAGLGRDLLIGCYFYVAAAAGFHIAYLCNKIIPIKVAAAIGIYCQGGCSTGNVDIAATALMYPQVIYIYLSFKIRSARNIKSKLIGFDGSVRCYIRST